MNTARKSAILASTMLMGVSIPAWAEDAAESSDGAEIVVTAARTILPANALPLTVDIIDNDDLSQQVAISGSVTDAVATLTPSFSPTRQKLSGAGETLRGRSPLYAINGIPQSTPLRDGSRDGFTIDAFFVDRVELIFGSNALQGVRRQNIWRNLRRRLAERGPRLGLGFRRRACGVASAYVRWSVA